MKITESIIAIFEADKGVFCGTVIREGIWLAQRLSQSVEIKFNDRIMTINCVHGHEAESEEFKKHMEYFLKEKR